MPHRSDDDNFANAALDTSAGDTVELKVMTSEGSETVEVVVGEREFGQ